MKKMLLTGLFAIAMLASPKLSAQWVVTDPTNFAQSIINTTQQIVQTSSTAKNMLNNFREVEKLYNQGKEYYDALKSVNNLIKDARKVKKTIEMVSEITDIYVNGFNKMVIDPNFTHDELEAISGGYAKLLEEGGALITELKNVVTKNNGLSLSDKERMEVIDQVYNKMVEYRNLTHYFTKKSISVSYLRAKKKNDTKRVLDLYGSPSERYW